MARERLSGMAPRTIDRTPVTRRNLLLGATATAATALFNACGGANNATDTPKPAVPTVPPTPTTGITPSPTVAPIATTAPIPAPAATATAPQPTVAVAAVATPTAVARVTPITTPSATATTPLIMFVGSETTNAPYTNEADSYPGQVIQMLLPTKYDYAKAGISHTTAATLGSQAPKTVDPFYSPARSKNIVVMWEGQSDLYQGADVEAAYTSLVNFCKARKAVGWKVVVLTLPPRALDNLDVVPARAHYEADRQTINTRLRANWSNFADALADVAANPEIGPVETLKNGDVYHVEDFRGPDSMTVKGKGIVAKIVAFTITSL